MFKTLTVSIGTLPFIIEEEAYAILDSYLRAIRLHFSTTADADEIVGDIESRIAEELSVLLGKSRKVIEKKDVDAVIASMGTVEDFRSFEGNREEPPKSGFAPFQKIRLYRDADNQVLGGVCAGIANYFSIDPIIIRLAFGLSILLGGFGVLLYIILWICVPEARTTAEKVEMTGGKLTLSALQKKIDDVVPPAKRKNIFAKIIAFPFQLIRVVMSTIIRVVKFVFPFVGRIVGLIVAVVCALAIAAMTFLFFAILLNPDSPYIGLPLHEAMNVTSYTMLLLSTYFVAFIPVLLVLLVGVSLLLMRNLFTILTVVILIVLWFGAGIAAAVTVFSVAPALEPVLSRYEENKERVYELENFQMIEANDIDSIEVVQGDTYSVTLIGGERGLATHRPVVNSGALSLEMEDDHNPCVIFCPSKRAWLHVTMPSLSSVSAVDASRVELREFSGGILELRTEDVARIKAELTVRALTVHSTDASHMELQGSISTLTGIQEDVSFIDGADLVTQDATLTLSGMSRTILDVRKTLKGSVSDTSYIEYLSDPDEVYVEVHDMASVRGRYEE